MVPLSMDSSFERLIGGKKRKRKDEEQPTFSFDINLVPYSEDIAAEYSWKQLVEKCQEHDDTHLEVNTPLKPKVIMKSQLTPTPKKKKKRRKLDAELEYDTDDPFIDDGELTDEEIPDEMQTARGGFYINTGNLMLIKRPIKIFDEDTEEMMDKLDKMDENGSETEPEENYQKEVETIENEEEITMSSMPEKKITLSPSKVSVKKSFVKVKKVKSLMKIKKIKEAEGPIVSSTPLVKKKKKKPAMVVESKKEGTSSVSPVKKVATPKKASTPQKVKTPKKEGSTPKKKPDTKKTVLKRKKILPSQLPDTSEYDDKVASFVEKIEDTWKCKVCQYENETKTGATSHAEQHLEGVTLKCVLCEKTFKMKKNLKQHVLKDHIVAEKLTKQRKKILPSQMPDTTAYDEKVTSFLVKSESGWKCNVCNYENEAKTNVSNHAEQHIENVTLNCKLCDKSFPMKRNLKQHVLKYHAITETIEIKVKSKTAIKKATSPKKKATKIVKKVGKDVKAKICKKISEPKKEVVVKKKIKATQMCDTTAYDAKVAELVEKVEDKWKCKGCEVSNDAKAFVLKHAEQHLEGFNLPCLLCEKTFSMKRNLRQHIYTRHKEEMATKKEEKKTDKSPKKKAISAEAKPKKGKENCEAKKPQTTKPAKEKKEKKLLQAIPNVIARVETPIITLS